MPLWMVALWLMFATVWTQLTRTTTLPGWLLTVLATLGGPVAYLIGERLGAVYRLYLSASDARRQLYRLDGDNALIITYARDIDGDDLVEATRDQCQAQGILQQEPQSEAWLSEYPELRQQLIGGPQ